MYAYVYSVELDNLRVHFLKIKVFITSLLCFSYFVIILATRQELSKVSKMFYPSKQGTHTTKNRD